MDEMVFLSLLSNPFDSYWSASYLYLWGYQFIVLAENKSDDAGQASPFFGRQGNREALDLERLQSIGLSKKGVCFYEYSIGSPFVCLPKNMRVIVV